TNMTSSGYELGCPIVPTVLEMAPGSEELRASCAEAFRRWEERLAQHYAATGLPEERARVLAKLTISALEGAVVLARAEQSTDPLVRAAQNWPALVRAAAIATASPACRTKRIVSHPAVVACSTPSRQ